LLYSTGCRLILTFARSFADGKLFYGILTAERQAEVSGGVPSSPLLSTWNADPTAGGTAAVFLFLES
jgi:hypothetical protein